MKFVCDNCQAHYMIADEKVGTRGVKVKCKKCQHVIVVKPDKGDGDSKRSKSDSKVPAAEGGRSKSSSKIAAVEAEGDGESFTADSTVVNQPTTGSAGGGGGGGAEAGVEDGEKPTTAVDVNALLRAAEASAPTAVNDSPDVRAALDKHRGATSVDVTADNDSGLPPSPPAPAPAPEPAPAPAAAAGGTSGDLENELAGAFDGLFSPGAQGREIPADRAPTKVYSPEQADMARGADHGSNGANGSFGGMVAEAPAAAPAPAPAPAAAAQATVEWYAAINDEQKGPFALPDIEAFWLKGDVTAESLVWRTGMADWIPLRDVKELKYLLDLIPQRKSAPPAASVPAPQFSSGGLSPATAPSSGIMASGLGLLPAADDTSEEAWRPRGMTSVYKAASAAEASVARASAPEPPKALEPADDVKWTPTAASSLASLVDDELAPKPKKPSLAPSEPAFKPPPAEDDSIEAPLPNLLGSGGAGGGLGGLAGLALPPPSAAPPEPVAPAPVAPRGGAAPLPFQPRPEGLSTGAKIGIAGGVVGLVAIALVIGVVVGGGGKQPQPELAANTPPPAQPAQPVAAQPAPAQPAPAQPVATTPAPAQPAAAGTTPTVASPGVVQPQAEKPPEKEPARAEPEEKKGGRTTKSRESGFSKPEREKPEKKEPERKFAPPEEEEEKPAPKPKKASGGDCDPILYPEGCENVKPKASAASAGKETLSKADILSVVKSNKGDITRCVGEQRKKDAALAAGIIKVAWVIKNDGRTSDVAIEDGDAGAYVSKCMVRAIQGWKFPAYSGDQLKPIKFPFKLDQF